MSDILSKSDREKAALALFIYRHEGGHYKNDLSQSAIEYMMIGGRRVSRWLKPDDLQRLLPYGVSVDESEVESFLRKSAHLFSEILSAPQQ